MNVIYISYDGCLEPLVESQVLVYLRGLHKTHGVRFHLITFDKPKDTADSERVTRRKKELLTTGITWHSLPYTNSPPLIAQYRNIRAAERLCLRIMRQDRIDLLHARSLVAGDIAYRVARRTSVPFIFDMRGFLLDQRVEAGLLSRHSPTYIIGKWRERTVFRHADHVITLTHASEPLLRRMRKRHGASDAVSVIPTCVDTQLFKRSMKGRRTLRKKLGIGSRFVVGHIGSFEKWYRLNAMLTLFRKLKTVVPDAFFLIISQDPRAAAMLRGQLDKKDYAIISASRSEMPAALSSLDLALIFLRTKKAGVMIAPTKFAELLRCGVPIIVSDGIGDLSPIVQKHKLGAVIQQFDDASIKTAISQALIASDSTLPRRAMKASEEYADEKGITAYWNIYKQLVGKRH